MSFKVPHIEIGFGLKWPTETLLFSLTNDRELGEAEWWRRMAILISVAAKSSDSILMDALDEAKKTRWGSGFPQVEVTTPQNLAQTEKSAIEQNSYLQVSGQATTDCFKHSSEFVKGQVESVVNDNYFGTDANLALIEIALFDHNLLKKRNAHTAFVRTLIAWGIIKVADDNAMKNIIRSIADKYKRLPKKGYKDWDDNFINEKTVCENIGKKLGLTMPYHRQNPK